MKKTVMLNTVYVFDKKTLVAVLKKQQQGLFLIEGPFGVSLKELQKFLKEDIII